MKDELLKILEERGRTSLPNVLFVSSECAPLAKTGGLADVVGTLPKYLVKAGMDARVITPYHRITKEKFRNQVQHMFHFYVDLGWRHEYCGIEKLDLDGVTIYLVDSEAYFGDTVYRGGQAEVEQYAFFQRAVLNALSMLDFRPEIIHCNDWQSAMIPMLARTQYKGCMQEKLKYLLSIHNIAYQGKWSFDFYEDLLSIDSAYYTSEFIELNGAADFLKAGCVFSDRLSTVSPNYAEEIKTPYFGEGLEGILNARSAQLCGILNGIDTSVFNPESDPLIPANYTVKDLSGKSRCKEFLQEKMGLERNPEIPLIAMVTRMTEQKGFELVMTVLDDLMQKEEIQFILLGTGDARYEQFMRCAEERYKGRLCSYIGYNEELSHLIYAGSDFFLMPSRFEPCGLSQMIAMRYGSLPIVRETGGLKDSVIPYDCSNGTGDGFSFANFDAWEMRNVISYALSCCKDPSVLYLLRTSAMKKDFSFEKSAEEYIRLYISMLDEYHEALPALVHCAPDEYFRKPFGAVSCGTEVRLAFKVLSGKVFSAKLILQCDSEQLAYEMEDSGELFSVSFPAPDRPASWKYFFETETRYGIRYLSADETGLSSELTEQNPEGFRLTVYRRDFETPSWMKNSIMYQIFPDRFGFYGKETVKRGIQFHKNLGQSPELHKNRSEPVKYLPDTDENEYYPDDFYGGTFRGIQRKLPYLKDLGVSCIYLNPIVEARSNHRYDAANYLNTDPILGTVEEFQTLCKKANDMGIRIILDGVYSHTGADSIYFNRFGHYGNGGACDSVDSPFYPWFRFSEWPETYKCWWNFADLPEVDERNPAWQEHVVSGNDSVMKTWLRRGAAGWRLDVADEIPDDVLTLMRQEVKKENPDAPLIGEVWEDPVTKTGPEGPRNYALGYSLDSVMNYPFRFAIIDFLRWKISAYDLQNFLLCQQMNYPKPLYESLMNLLSSHDVDRIRTALSSEIDIRSLHRDEQMKLEFSEETLKKAVNLEKLAAAVQFAIPGMPSIYYGDEQGMTGVCDPFNRMPFREDSENTGLKDYYTELCHRRIQSDALRIGEAKFSALSDDVLAIFRYTSKEAVVTVVNRSDRDFNYSLDCRFLGKGTITGQVLACSANMHEIR